jgi:hypothetical protein
MLPSWPTPSSSPYTGAWPGDGPGENWRGALMMTQLHMDGGARWRTACGHPQRPCASVPDSSTAIHFMAVNPCFLLITTRGGGRWGRGGRFQAVQYFSEHGDEHHHEVVDWQPLVAASLLCAVGHVCRPASRRRVGSGQQWTLYVYPRNLTHVLHVTLPGTCCCYWAPNQIFPQPATAPNAGSLAPSPNNTYTLTTNWTGSPSHTAISGNI